MQCVQAWKIISISQLEGIVDTVKNRLLSFVLEIEEIDPDAGESKKINNKIPPEKINQVFNNYILGNNNIVGSGTDFSQSVHQSITKGDLSALQSAVKDLGGDSEDITKLSKALDLDGERTKKDGIGTNVKIWIGNIVQKVAQGGWKLTLETAAIILSQLISSYYGWK